MAINISQRLKILNNTKKTVFTTQDLQSIWQENPQTTVIIAKRMVDKELLFKLAKGYYVLNQDYNPYELANSIISPSYVSFISALSYWDVCFQFTNTIYSVTNLNYSRKIKDTTYKYYAIKKKLFFNLEGVLIKDNISIATPERAILDSFYFGLLINIDNAEKINLTFLKKISLFYPQSVQKQTKNFIKKYAS